MLTSIRNRFKVKSFMRVTTIPYLYVLLAICVTGCSSEMLAGDGPENNDPLVSGTVKLNGKPVADANVVFVPVSFESQDGDKQYLAYGTTDSEGNFELVRANGTPGASAGWHRVIISKLTPAGRKLNVQSIFDFTLGEAEPGAAENAANELGFEGQPEHELIPAIYSKRSVLTFEIPEGEESAEANFELTKVDPFLLQDTDGR